MQAGTQLPDLLCFSHLRWNLVYQRPQHLMTRFARITQVFYIEEPVFDSPVPRLEITPCDGLRVLTPHLPESTPGQTEESQRSLLDEFWSAHAITRPLLWYYTPMAVPLTRHLRPAAAVYDCMDELSAFAFAPPALKERERELFHRVDLVFTGGISLYNAKRRLHRRVYPFPSSVDERHFGRALDMSEAADQADIPSPKIGFFGVIDERMDLDLLAGLAQARPDWNFILIGPTVKIDPAGLPLMPNLHYLGPRAYGDLPAYLAGWQVAMLPFARNEATRYISPTKVPEYLAAGLPVVSTSISDVVSTFERRGLVRIADSVEQFASAIGLALREDPHTRRSRVAPFLQKTSWDRTWTEMRRLVEDVVRERAAEEAHQVRPSVAAVQETSSV